MGPEPADAPPASGGQSTAPGARLWAWVAARPTWLALGLYLLCVLGIFARSCGALNPDGICYIRLAGYLAEGRLADFASGYWSPLLPASVAPFLALGLDGVAAARIALTLWGAAFIVLGMRLAPRLADVPAAWRPALAAALAMTAAWFATFAITPDLVLATCLLGYFALNLSAGLLRSRSAALLCGLAGGVCYLAKAYAFPFFLVHFPASIALRYWNERRPSAPGAGTGADEEEHAPVRPGAALGALAAGLLGFALVAGPWIGALSAKYGRATFSTAGAPNHAVMGPPPGHPLPHIERLWTPEPGRICIWETPEKLPYGLWSPFEGVAGMVRQLQVALGNQRYMRGCFDTLGLTLGLAGAAPLLLVLLWPRRRERFALLWGVGTMALYCSGYLVVFVEERYLAPVVWPLGCILCLHFAHLGLSAAPLERTLGAARLRLARVVAVALVAASFAGYPLARVALAAASGEKGPSACRVVAGALDKARLSGPVASSAYGEGFSVAFFRDQTYLGRPASADPAARQAELDAAGAQVFLVWGAEAAAPAFPPGSPWQLVIPDAAAGAGAKVRVAVYARGAATAGTAGPGR